MFICECCGHTFEEPTSFTETHGLTEPPFESYDGCPVCGEPGPLKADTCNGCGKVFVNGDLYGGYCKNCLKDILDYDIGFEYLVDEDRIVSFAFIMLYGMEEPDYVTEEFRQVMTSIVHGQMLTDKYRVLQGKRKIGGQDILDAMRDYILSDEYEIANFGYWLERRREQHD